MQEDIICKDLNKLNDNYYTEKKNSIESPNYPERIQSDEAPVKERIRQRRNEFLSNFPQYYNQNNVHQDH